MKVRAIACLACALSAFGIPAQAQSAAGFEVVSIALCPSNTLSGRAPESQEIFATSDSRVTFQCRTVRSLIDEAWLGIAHEPKAFTQFQNGSGHGSMTIQSQKSQGPKSAKNSSEVGPAWLDSDLYTIEIKSDSPRNPEEMAGPILQSVLQDKFRVQVLREVQEVRSYKLVVSGDGPRLRPAAEEKCAPSLLNSATPACGVVRRIDSHKSELTGTLDTLCRRFSVWLNRDVSNETGLAGTFDIQLPFVQEDLNAGVLSGESFGAQFQLLARAAESLGLELQTTTKSSEVLLVNRAERPADVR